MGTFESLRREILAAAATQPSTVFNTYSGLWQRILVERQDELQRADLSAFLSSGSSMAAGTIGRTGDPEAFAAFYADLVPQALSDRHPVSQVGQPVTFAFRGGRASVSHLDKLAVLQILSEWVPHRGGDILEVGAGYGGLAYLILQTEKVRSYTFIDLPENLINTAYFLSQNFPDLPIRVGAPDQGHGINLVLAGHIGVIDSHRFDLAINADSLGEMMAATTRAYVSWVRTHLRPTGLFFSKNGHRRGRGHVQHVSEYGYRQFGLKHLRPPVDASSLFDDFSHLVLLGDGEMSDRQVAHVDTLADLYALGLHAELIDCSDRVARDAADQADVRFLSEAARYFHATRVEDKVAALTTAGPFETSVSFMRGMALGTAHRHRAAAPHLRAYLQQARSFVAEAYCHLLLSFRDRRWQFPTRTGAAGRYFRREVEQLNALPPGIRALAYRIRIDNMRKKITAPEHWRSGPLNTLKNVVFNLREGKGFALER